MWKRLLCASVLVVGCVVAPALSAQATFSGENGRIAFRRYLDTEQTTGAVFTIRPNGHGERQVTHPPSGFVDQTPDVSPDGRRIAFERFSTDDATPFNEVFVVDVDGSNLTQLTRNAPGEFCNLGGTCSGSPAWSPDGREIAFKQASGPIRDDLFENVGIFVMKADGSNVRRITQLVTPGLGEDLEPQWSPNGRKLVFWRTNVRTAPLEGIAVWTINIKTGRERRITPWELRAGDTPDWSPDGRRILFHSNIRGPEDVSANLYTIRPNGTGLKQLTFEQGGARNYLGSSYSPDGTRITVGRRPAGEPADVYIMRSDGTHIRQLTHTVLYDSFPDWGPLPENDR
jgi:TolB protein